MQQKPKKYAMHLCSKKLKFMHQKMFYAFKTCFMQLYLLIKYLGFLFEFCCFC